jgi:uncharacterized protein (TIGR02453 family)
MSYFTRDTFTFLDDLAKNNDREWFDAHRHRYETHVKEPALRFIMDFAPELHRISPHFRADPRPVGGSLFRINRDIRFSKDKSPYKTHTGIHFSHESGKDAHAPVFYLHLEPRQVFVGVGIWRPDAPTLKRIRARLVEDTAGWKRTINGKAFRERFQLSGDSLERVPRGYDADHPLAVDLKRKDFIGVCSLDQAAITSATLPRQFAAICRDGKAFVGYLCKALGLKF